MLLANVERLAPAVADFLCDKVCGPEQARAFWRAVPAVLSMCDEQETYELPMAAEAYAWLHLLDCYARSWEALEELTAARCLPLGRFGVNTLDVGAGPGPVSLATADFYQALTAFAERERVPELVQATRATCVELSLGQNTLRHHMAEHMRDYLDLTVALPDLGQLDPPAERRRYADGLLRQTYWDDLNGYCEDIYTPSEAAEETQHLHRYKLVVLSNFLTSAGTVERFRRNIQAVLQDLRPGAVVLLVGARSGRRGEYEEVRELFRRIAAGSGLEACLPPEGVEVSAEDLALRDVFYEEQLRVYRHVSSLAGDPVEPIPRITAYFEPAKPSGRQRRTPSRSTVLGFRKGGSEWHRSRGLGAHP